LELQISRLEAELGESRIAIMLSEIQPHFIYNTLGTIEQLCLKDPQMASELVRNFSLYLRANLSELDSIVPILFSDEIKHVQYYVNIEKVRFPDMTIEYQLDMSDFSLPAISVQPLVENAIKHGLMPLESGGRVVIRSYQTDTHFCVEVTDNGVGFDTGCLIYKKEHVGLYNVRERLRAIVNGELRVESTEGAGTTATILIPKEKTT
jgi:LytS/YehU family sensor histidine kinase